MINCIECPFLANVKNIWLIKEWVCTLKFTIMANGKEPVSKDCKLDVVTYTLKDKEESINFVPKEMEVKPTVILCKSGEIETARKIIDGTS